jgi:hypothetical protein
MSGAVTAVAVGAAVAAAGYSAYESKKAGKQQAAAAERQAKQAETAALKAEQDQNRANRREANVMGLLTDNTNGGLGSTSLTGAAGAPVDNSLLGGGNSLLGG